MAALQLQLDSGSGGRCCYCSYRADENTRGCTTQHTACYGSIPFHLHLDLRVLAASPSAEQRLSCKTVVAPVRTTQSGMFCMSVSVF